jgi:hypothetical protein
MSKIGGRNGWKQLASALLERSGDNSSATDDEEKVVQARYKTEAALRDAVSRQRREHTALIHRHMEEMNQIQQECEKVGHEFIYSNNAFLGRCRWCGAPEKGKKG